MWNEMRLLNSIIKVNIIKNAQKALYILKYDDGFFRVRFLIDAISLIFIFL